MFKNYKDVIEYLETLKVNKGNQFQLKNDGLNHSEAWQLEQDIKALETVINIVKSDNLK